MTHTFILHIYDTMDQRSLYSEYHNFKKFPDGTWVYYRGGATMELEIEMTEEAATKAMAKLTDSGWLPDRPKALEIFV
jgi:hypothetical protein